MKKYYDYHCVKCFPMYCSVHLVSDGINPICHMGKECNWKKTESDPFIASIFNDTKEVATI